MRAIANIFKTVAVLFFGLTALATLDGESPSTRHAPIWEVLHQARLDYWNKTIVEAYEQVGHHSPLWDDAARKMLALRVLQNASFGPPDPNMDEEILGLGQDIIDAGCDDPLVLSVYERSYYRTDLPRDSKYFEQVVFKAESHFQDSKYPPILQAKLLVAKCSCYANSDFKRTKTHEELADALDLAQRDLAETLSYTRIPDLDVLLFTEDLGFELRRMYAPEEALTRVQKILAAGRPHSTLALDFEGNFLQTLAWQAEDGPYYSTGTDDGKKRFYERLERAGRALTRACEQDPNDFYAATKMLRVLNAEPDDFTKMESYFHRAVAVCPGFYEAYAQKELYLGPARHGSAKRFVEFGRLCLRTGDDADLITFFLATEHLELASHYDPDADDHFTLTESQEPAPEYFRLPGVWDDYVAIYRPFIAKHPNAYYSRTKFAYFAALAGKKELAARELKALGEHASAWAMDGLGDLNRLRTSVGLDKLKKTYIRTR